MRAIDVAANYPKDTPEQRKFKAALTSMALGSTLQKMLVLAWHRLCQIGDESELVDEIEAFIKKENHCRIALVSGAIIPTGTTCLSELNRCFFESA